MKKHFLILLCLGLFLIGSVQAADAIANAAASVNLESVMTWMQTNWASVALIVSEVAALISVKYTGIVKTILSIVGQLIQKKSKP